MSLCIFITPTQKYTSKQIAITSRENLRKYLGFKFNPPKAVFEQHEEMKKWVNKKVSD